jgi:hypothetical protein
MQCNEIRDNLGDLFIPDYALASSGLLALPHPGNSPRHKEKAQPEWPGLKAKAEMLLRNYLVIRGTF